MSEQTKIKRLYTFTLQKEEEVERNEESVNEAGEKVTVTKKVVEKLPHVFFIKKPTRSLYDEAELFYGSEMAKAIKAGMMTRSQLEKRFSNDGGILSEPERVAYATLLTSLRDKQMEYQKASLKNPSERTPEENKQFTDLLTDLLKIQNNLQTFQLENESLYSSTADVRARNKTIIWWILNVCCQEDSDKEIQFFNGETLEDKLKDYDSIIEGEDEFKTLALNRFIYLYTLYYLNRAQNKEDFDYFLEQLDKPNT
jgi:hypothetical protein